MVTNKLICMIIGYNVDVIMVFLESVVFRIAVKKKNDVIGSRKELTFWMRACFCMMKF